MAATKKSKAIRVRQKRKYEHLKKKGVIKQEQGFTRYIRDFINLFFKYKPTKPKKPLSKTTVKKVKEKGGKVSHGIIFKPKPSKEDRYTSMKDRKDLEYRIQFGKDTGAIYTWSSKQSMEQFMEQYVHFKKWKDYVRHVRVPAIRRQALAF